MSDSLFPMTQPEPVATRPGHAEDGAADAAANRDQIPVAAEPPGVLARAGSRARVVWEFVQGLDLSGFHERILAREGSGGRPRSTRRWS